jgi:hypothetical protein
MIELADTCPDINVQPAEYKRLLGYPQDWVVRDRARELVDWAREWYAKHGQPWVYARQAECVQTGESGTIEIDDTSFASTRLWKTLRDAEADGAIVVAAGAGPEIEEEAHRLWKDEKPDEYFFLEVYGSAIVEHLITVTGAKLCAWAEARKMAVLPHYSPGYPEWPIDEQARLLEVINRGRSHSPVPVEVLESGMLRPKKSLLAVFGLTRQTDRVNRLTDLVPCQNCSFTPCQYRRAPYRRAPASANPELAALAGAASAVAVPPATPLERNAAYSVNAKALERWRAERLSLAPRPDGGIEATFRYDGTTCTNMGRPLAFRYQVTLGPREEGFPIRQQRCEPVDGDTGHRYMCRYMSNREHLLAAIDHEQPLNGQPLNDVLRWTRAAHGAGCYCEPDSRQHKWGLVLETIHYALARAEE